MWGKDRGQRGCRGQTPGVREGAGTDRVREGVRIDRGPGVSGGADRGQRVRVGRMLRQQLGAGSADQDQWESSDDVPF